jgi:hypothetical protein
MGEDSRQKVRPGDLGRQLEPLGQAYCPVLVEARGSAEAGHAQSHREGTVAADHFRDGIAALGKINRSQRLIKDSG